MAVSYERYALSGREVSASDLSLEQRSLSRVVCLSAIVKPLEKRGQGPKMSGSATGKKIETNTKFKESAFNSERGIYEITVKLFLQ
jgi:hypothetical protein